MPYKQMYFLWYHSNTNNRGYHEKILFLIVIFFTFPALAQESTLISGDIESGGFGGPLSK